MADNKRINDDLVMFGPPSSFLVIFAFFAVHLSACGQPDNALAVSTNPKPGALPSLWVYQNEEKLLMLAARFPDVPDFTCESWCYESDLDFVSARPLDGGRIELRHREKKRPEVLLVTTATPEPGAVEIVARAELDPVLGKDKTLPNDVLVPNLCWQVRKAPEFASKPDPYPEFVKRCFILTGRGRVFLDKTDRRKIPCRPPDHEYNNPPWVQMYLKQGATQPETQPTAWADYSADRYTIPVIGVISRDGKYLAALANDSASMMAQAWHDCEHNNPAWQPSDAPPGKRVWRLKIYAMKNDAAAFLSHICSDFPALSQ